MGGSVSSRRPIELNDLWSKTICRPKMIVRSGATLILSGFFPLRGGRDNFTEIGSPGQGISANMLTSTYSASINFWRQDFFWGRWYSKASQNADKPASQLVEEKLSHKRINQPSTRTPHPDWYLIIEYSSYLSFYIHIALTLLTYNWPDFFFLNNVTSSLVWTPGLQHHIELQHSGDSSALRQTTR